jgi:hypothetical protein
MRALVSCSSSRARCSASRGVARAVSTDASAGATRASSASAPRTNRTAVRLDPVRRVSRRAYRRRREVHPNSIVLASTDRRLRLSAVPSRRHDSRQWRLVDALPADARSIAGSRAATTPTGRSQPPVDPAAERIFRSASRLHAAIRQPRWTRGCGCLTRTSAEDLRERGGRQSRQPRVGHSIVRRRLRLTDASRSAGGRRKDSTSRYVVSFANKSAVPLTVGAGGSEGPAG